ncbi:MAG TPA: HEPN domain-containing protein [Pyrinomonadaceae bacterium]
MNRGDFQKLAELRLDDAKVLLETGRYAGAYYLIGYAVECALKACIAKQTQQYDFPIENSRRLYVHDLNSLLSFSGLSEEHRKNSEDNADFRLNWAIAKDWKEDARYSLEIDKDKAEALYAAVTDGKDGIVAWLQKWW